MTHDRPSLPPLLDGFEPEDLQQLLGVALARGGDYADLFFEEREEGTLRMEEGQVRSASRGSVFGIGVRVLCGERTGYAYSEDRSPAAVRRAAETAAAIADQARDPGPIRVTRGEVRSLYTAKQPLLELSPVDQVGWLERADAAARAVDPRVRRVEVSLDEQVRRIAVVSSDGTLVEDVQPMVSMRVTARASEGEQRSLGSAADGGRHGLEFFDGTLPEDLGRRAAEKAMRNLDARPAPGGPQPVVLGNAYSGILLHEAVGHGLEADFNRKGFSRYSGQIGERVASPLVTVIDDGTMPSERGTVNVDDEGNLPRRNVLIEKGILKSYLHDRLSARLMNVGITGSGRRESYAEMPLPRMTNTLMPAGTHDPAEILASVKRGIYAVSFGGGQVEIGKGDFVFAATEAYLIEDGKVTAPLRDVTLIGNGPDVMSRVDMVGTDYRTSEGMWTCGKDGQSVPVGVGMPTVKISSITVGGTGA